MKTLPGVITLVCLGLTSCNKPGAGHSPGSYLADASFLRKHTRNVIELSDVPSFLSYLSLLVFASLSYL